LENPAVHEQRGLHNHAGYFFLVLAGYVATLVINKVLVNAFSPEVYGDYSVLVAILQGLAPLVTIGLEHAIFTYFPLYHQQNEHHKIRAFFTFSIRIMIIMGTGLAVVSGAFLWIIHVRPHLGEKFHITMIYPWVAFFLGIMSYYICLLRFKGHSFLAYITGNLLQIIVYTVLIFLADMFISLSIFSAMMLYVSSFAIAIFILAGMAHSKFGKLTGDIREDAFTDRRDWLKTGSGLMIQFMSTYFIIALPVLILEGHPEIRESSVGIFALALNIFIIPFSLVETTIDASVIPALAAAFITGNRDRFVKHLKAINRISIVTAAVYFLCVFLFGRKVIALFHPGFVTGYTYALVFCAGFAINMGMLTTQAVSPFIGLNKQISQLFIFCFFFELVAGIMATHIAGIMGMVSILAATQAILGIVPVCMVYRKLKIWSL
jgi:O-antigen/teichoic acid export membrane protein